MSTNINGSSSMGNQLSLTEVMQRTLCDFQGFQETLKQDCSERTVNKVMDALSVYKIDKRLPGKISIFIMETTDIQHIPTHDELVKDIDSLVDMLKKNIADQQRKEEIQAQQYKESIQAAQSKEDTQPQQDGNDAQLPQNNTEDIRAQQHKENVEFVRAILKVMMKHADEVTCWLEESMK